jgi:hypothetical protein
MVGYILCRLPPDSRALERLAIRLHRSAWLLGLPDGGFADLGPRSRLDVYCNMIAQDTEPFRLPIAFRLLSRKAHVRIYLSLTGKPADSALISGFPRKMGE